VTDGDVNGWFVFGAEVGADATGEVPVGAIDAAFGVNDGRSDGMKVSKVVGAIVDGTFVPTGRRREGICVIVVGWIDSIDGRMVALGTGRIEAVGNDGALVALGTDIGKAVGIEDGAVAIGTVVPGAELGVGASDGMVAFGNDNGETVGTDG
jgi:hypothetical protein